MSDASAPAALPATASGTGLPATAGTATGREAKLDDIMLAMDVVDTLRHQEKLVARELDEDAREAQLIERLREIYTSQGLAVSDQILRDGVKALKESRFVYTPPPPGTARTLALLWIRRGTLLRTAVAIVAAVAIGWAAYGYFVGGAAERARIEITETLPAELDRAHKAVLAEARVPAARDRAQQVLNDGRLALERKDPAGARNAIAAMNGLLDRLRQEYTLRIVSRPGEQSGIWRNPQGRPTQRNYYLIVEVLSPTGQPVKLPITSEEDQKTTSVDRFGIRVSEQVFDQIRRDKADDGIIQRAVIGQKARGALDPTYSLPVQGGMITSGW